MKSSWYGKAATFLLFLLVFTVTFFTDISAAAINVMCSFVIAVMVFAFVMYIVEYCAEIKKDMSALSRGKKSSSDKKED